MSQENQNNVLPFPSNQSETNETFRLPKRVKRNLGLAGVAAASAGVLLNWANPGMHESKLPEPEPKSLMEHAQEAAHIPVDFESETVVIKVKVKDSQPAEAFYSNPEVQEYMADNPDEKTSLETSINSLSSTETDTYGIVETDIDNDGDLDAVAKPIVKE